MATMLLQSVGTAVGGAIGGPLGAAMGRFGGSLLGSLVDQSLMGSGGTRTTQGPRLETMPVLACEEGASIPRVYGRVRIGGQIIWATRFEEQSTTTRTRSSGKGSSKSAKSTTTYQYFANFAVGLCEGEIAQVRRIWADGREIDQSNFNIRIYRGDETQRADPLIVAKEGSAVPAFRGTAYVVFEHFPIGGYGNRIPQLSFEVIRPLQGLGERIKGVNIIPGSTEYGYATSRIFQYEQQGVAAYENRHQLIADTDWAASLDALQALCPNLESVVLVIAWFGDDLRAGHCSVAPRVERHSKQTAWSVAGLERSRARSVSLVEGRPAYGGTPTDKSVLEAIADLKARGLSVTVSPFLMMDVPQDEDRKDPWTGLPQERFPWRGKISCSPAPGVDGSVHGTIAARQQVESFFGSPNPPSTEWSYRRFILHYATLCAQSAGVDAFLLGSELAALTPVRDAVREPAVDALIHLASSVRTILGSKVKISYAANWTEYGSWTLDGKTISFPLDPFWSDANVNFIGIDFYAPLTDWRDGEGHADATLSDSIYSGDYLRSRLSGGEGFDWYYRNSEDRRDQLRLPITDEDHQEAWMFRPKDLYGWWSHQHYARDNGVRRAVATPWVPQSKPIWFIECGCAAIDRASNAPHVFFDTKAGFTAAPYFSRSSRDDLIQEATIEAILDVYGVTSEALNPRSSIYSGSMVDPSRIHIWSWDARPFPAFPSLIHQWADSENWAKGHWLNGRLEGLSLPRLLRALWADFGAGELAALSSLSAKVDGYCVDRVMSLRDAVTPLSKFFRFDLVNDLQQARIVTRRDATAISISDDDLADDAKEAPFEIVIEQAIDVPDRLELGFCDGDDHYTKNSLAIGNMGRAGGRQERLDVPVVLSAALAQKHGEDFLQDLWVARETITFRLRPAAISLQIGDVVTIPRTGISRRYQIEKISDGDSRSFIGRAIDPHIFNSATTDRAMRAIQAPSIPLPPIVEFIETAGLGSATPALQYVAVTARQWLGPQAIWRQAAGRFRAELIAESNATSGFLVSDLRPCSPQLLRRGLAFTVQLNAGGLVSKTMVDVLAGANRAFVQHPDESWELIAFASAQLVDSSRYEISDVLRGIGGSDALAQSLVAAGSRFVLFDDAVLPIETDVSQIDALTTWRIGLASLDYSHVAFKEMRTRLRGLALRPWAPAHITLKRLNGDLEIGMARRSRANFELWDSVDIPLGEEGEAYELDINRNGEVVRTLHSTQPWFHYPSEMELRDFGERQAGLSVSVYQMSALLGRGIPASSFVSIK